MKKKTKMQASKRERRIQNKKHRMEILEKQMKCSPEYRWLGPEIDEVLRRYGD